MKIWINGNLVDKEQATLNVFDHGVLYGDGVFEGIRIYNGKIFQNTAHLDRLYKSAEQVRLTVNYTPQQLTEAMQQCITANEIKNGYIRLVVTRGVGTLGLNPTLCPESCTFIIADNIRLYSQEMYDNGMPVILAKTIRTSATMLSPKVKSLNYMNNILGKLEAVDAGVLEAIMCNAEGNVAEGTGDNIFIVKDGVLMTPPPEAGILLGITREVVMLLAERAGIEVRQQNFRPEVLLTADECFLTGSAAEVISITSVDGKPIADGKVGPVTKQLLAAFREFILTDEQVEYIDQ